MRHKDVGYPWAADLVVQAHCAQQFLVRRLVRDRNTQYCPRSKSLFFANLGSINQRPNTSQFTQGYTPPPEFNLSASRSLICRRIIAGWNIDQRVCTRRNNPVAPRGLALFNPKRCGYMVQICEEYASNGLTSAAIVIAPRRACIILSQEV